LTELALGENCTIVECNVKHMFQVIRSDRLEVEMWQIFDLYSETSENVVWSPNYCSCNESSH